MAQLKDLLVNGVSRFIGDVFANKAQLTSLEAPTTDGGSTYEQTSGKILRAGSSSIYWGGLAAADIPNLDASKITSGTLPVARGGTGQTSIANIQAGKDGDGNTISSTYLKKSGGTMTGALTLSGAPTSDLHAATKKYVDDAFAANDAMIFKGTISGGSTGDYGALTGAANRGWTYKVDTAGKINGVAVEVGDILICLDDNTAAATSSNYATAQTHWVIVQNNVDGAVFKSSNSFTDGKVIIADGTSGKVKTSSYSLGATINSGTANQVAYYSDANTIDSMAPAWQSWTAGSTNGPQANIQIGNAIYQSAAIPSATATDSGIVTTAAQTFAGDKTFQGNIFPAVSDSYNLGSTALRWKFLYGVRGIDLTNTGATGITVNNTDIVHSSSYKVDATGLAGIYDDSHSFWVLSTDQPYGDTWLKSKADRNIIFERNGTENARFDTTGHFIPGTTATFNLGNTTNRWHTLYLKSGTINYMMPRDTSASISVITIKDTSDQSIASFGFHNTGNQHDDAQGAIYLIPHYQGLGDDSAYGGKHGLYIGTTTLKWENKYILRYSETATDGQVIISDGTTGNVKTSGYTIGASIGTGTANRIAYYSEDHKIDAGSIVTNGSYLGSVSYLSINNAHQTGYRLFVNGSQKITSGSLQIYPTGGSYNDGIRIHARSIDNTWAALMLCGSDNTGDTGTSANSWFIGNNSGSLYITKNGSASSATGYLAATTETVNDTNYGYWAFYHRIGINGKNTGYNLYVNGTSLFTNAVRIQYQGKPANLYLYDNSNDTSTHSIIRLGAATNENAAYIFLNGPSRTNDGGANVMTIRNNVGNLRLNNLTIFEYKNTWLDPSRLQIGRQTAEDTLTDRAIIGVTNGNLHIDSYSNSHLYLQHYATGQNVYVGKNTAGSNQLLHVYGKMIIDPSYHTSNSHNEGIRINLGSNGWALINFGGAALSTSGTGDGQWLVGRRGNAGTKAGAIGDFTIEEQDSTGAGLTLHKDACGATLWTSKVNDIFAFRIISNAATDTIGTGYQHGIWHMVPNMGASAHAAGLIFGKAASAGNAGCIEFVYSGTSNGATNCVGIGFWSKNNIVRIYNNQTVTIGNATNVGGFGLANTDSTTGNGISLFNGGVVGMPQYGIAFAGTGTFGTFGGCTESWATYFTTSNTANRGWIFKRYVGTDANTKKGYNSAAIRASDGVYFGGGVSLYHPNKNAWCGDFYIHTIGTANSGDGNATRGTEGITLLRVGNNIAWPAAGTAGGDNNSTGIVRIYAENTYFTDIMSQTGSANRTFYLPNYNANMYAVHAANNNAVGSATQPVYVAANGRVTACTDYGSGAAGYLSLPRVTQDYNTLPGNNLTMIKEYSNSSANRPTNHWYHAITSKGSDGNYATQFAMGMTITRLYYRNYSGAAWSAWKQVWIAGDAVTSAVWNDYAEYRETDTMEAGRCVMEVGDDSMILSTKRLQRGCSITSDTWGFAQGETEKAKTPIAVSGRVLAYPYESREEFASHIGWPVCSGPNGTVSIMTEEEEEKYPSRIIGTISAIPNYEEWGGGENADRPPVKVNGRVWIRIR